MNPANAAANTKDNQDSCSPLGVCPLMGQKVQLLPLRYGLVEQLDPAAGLELPYALKTRPLGVRLIRDGYLYIIEESSGYLHEYRIEDGKVSKLLWQAAEVAADSRTNEIGEPALIFPRAATLYVAYSELQWTARKCSQVLADSQERQYFMQCVELAGADAENGGRHLLTRTQAQQWLAEVAEQDIPADARLHPQEQQAYHWQQSSTFRSIELGELFDQLRPDYQDDMLFLAVQDDIGVMRDLAVFQDNVVDWIGQWADGGGAAGANERDYVLACYIESLSQLTEQHWDAVQELYQREHRLRPLFEDIQQRPEQEQQLIRTALLDYLNQGSHDGQFPETGSITMPDDLKQAMSQAKMRIGVETLGDDTRYLQGELREEDKRYYTRAFLRNAGVEDAFVERHLEALIRLKEQQNKHNRALLYGAKWGQRGINDLIDRPRMDAFLAQIRPDLQRWNGLLERISEDRAMLLTQERFHRAAWYYDSQQAEQIGLAFATQYACLKDICRSDAANDAIFAWLEKNPQFDRPLFHTLSLSERSALLVGYAGLVSAGYGLVGNLPKLSETLQQLEADRLPALDQMPETVRNMAQNAQATLNPALAHGISRMMEKFQAGLGQQRVPALDELFRDLPKALSMRLLEAARTEGISFTVGSEAELEALRRDLRDVIGLRTELKRLNNQRVQVKNNTGHGSDRYQELLAERQRVQGELSLSEKRLAAMLSPIAELPDNSVRAAGAAPNRPGITLALPAAQQQQVAGLLQNIRGGYAHASPVSQLGDGIGIAVFIAQLVNLVQVWRETLAISTDQRNLMPLFNAVFSTGAAGFSAAQAIADNALKARSAQLVESLQAHALEGLHVQMGKLHIGLGLISYVFGGLAAVGSSVNHYEKWAGAIRSGNAQALAGATLAMAGSGGLLGANLYGLGHTAHAAGQVLKYWSDIELRRMAWAAAGTRLSTVFLRFNLVGLLFTALELAGSWWYNRNDTSAHDQWLLGTPWSRDTAKRQSHSLTEYQQQLQRILSMPLAQVLPRTVEGLPHDAPRTEIYLHLPALPLSALAAPLLGPAPARLYLAAYAISTTHYERGNPRIQWFPVSEQAQDTLHCQQEQPLTLRLLPPASASQSLVGLVRTELLLDIRLEWLDGNGQYQPQRYRIRLAPADRGEYPVSQHSVQGPEAGWIAIDPLQLPDKRI